MSGDPDRLDRLVRAELAAIAAACGTADPPIARMNRAVSAILGAAGRAITAAKAAERERIAAELRACEAQGFGIGAKAAVLDLLHGIADDLEAPR